MALSIFKLRKFITHGIRKVDILTPWKLPKLSEDFNYYKEFDHHELSYIRGFVAKTILSDKYASNNCNHNLYMRDYYLIYIALFKKILVINCYIGSL